MRLLRLILRYNLRSLSVRSADAVTTLLGIALTSAVVVIVMALDRGIAKAFAVSGSSDVVIFMRRSAVAEVQGWLDHETAKLIATLDGVREPVSKEVVTSATFRRRDGGQMKNIIVRGIDAEGIDIRPSFRLLAGRLPSSKAAEVVVARRIADRYVGLGLGETFSFGRYTFAVVGIFEAGGPNDNEIWGSTADVQAAFDRAQSFTSIRARLAGATDSEREASLARLKREVAENPRLPLQVQRESVYYARQEESAAELPKVLGRLLAVFLAIGAGFGAMNTMYGRVVSRTREIGTLRALGFGRRVIVASFVLEAALLGTVGGTLGAALVLPAHGFSSTATALTNFSEVTYSLSITPDGILAGLVLAASVGVLGGILPALHASRMEIPVALKEL